MSSFATQSSTTDAALPTRVLVFPSNEATKSVWKSRMWVVFVPENVCIIKMIQFSSRTKRKRENEKLLYATCDWTCLNHDCWRPNISLSALDSSQSFVISLLLLIFPVDCYFPVYAVWRLVCVNSAIKGSCWYLIDELITIDMRRN